MPRALPALLLVLASGPGAAALAQPLVVWKEAATPAFDLASGQALLDDGTLGDAVSADGLFTLELNLPPSATPTASRTIHYAVVPDGGTLADAVGAASGGPMILTFPDGGARILRIFFGTGADPNEPLNAGCTDPLTILSCKGFSPIPGVADSWTLQSTFGVTGDLQALFGGTPWVAGSADTQLALLAGEGQLDLLAAVPLSGTFGITNATGTVSLARDGWDLSGTLPLASGFPVDIPAWTRAHIEVRLQRGMARIEASPGAAFTPLLSEVSFEAAAPFVEIHNPAAARLSLTGIYLGDDPLYYEIASPPAAASTGDFTLAFPAGAWLPPGSFATLSLQSAAAFTTALGVAPDFVLASAPPAFPGSVDPAAALEAAGESLFLFGWSPGDPLVTDIDLLVWGAPVAGDEAPDKSGVTVGAGTYGSDAMDVNTTPAPAGDPLERIDFQESGEARDPAANGLRPPGGTDHDDETSEPLDTTWQVAAAPTPGAPPPGFSFSVLGTVTRTSNGTALENVVITATPGGEFAITDASGFYRLPLADASYTLDAHLYHHVDVSLPVTLAGGNLQLDLSLDRIPDIRVAGRVEREDGSPLEGALVRLWDRPDQENVARVTTGLDGSFDFRTFPRGLDARVVASKAGFRARGANRNAATAVTDIVLVLPAIPTGFDVTGHVEDADTGQPLAGAAVAIDDLGAIATADAAGDFLIALVPPGTFDLRAGAPNYAPQTVAVTVVDQAVALPPIRLVQASNALVLRGKVTVVGLGVPVADAELTLSPEAGGATQLTRTNSLGDYVFGGVAAGTYAFQVTAAGYADHLEAALPVTLTLTHDIELTPAAKDGFTLGGIVQLADKSTGQWNGSKVELEGGGTFKSNRTNGAGEFSFSKLEPGVYRVTATHSGYEGASLEMAVAGDASQSFILQRSADEKKGLTSCLGCAQRGRPTASFASLLFALSLGLAFASRRR